MKWLAILFSIFIISVIILADLGYLDGQLNALHSIPFGDKLGHFLLIGILSFLVISALIRALPARDPKLVAVSTALLLAFIFTMEEASQKPIVNRDASFADLAANYAGIMVFGLTAWAANRKKKA